MRDYAIFLLGPDGVVRTWNSGAGRLKGYSASEVIGQHFSIFYTAHDRAQGRPEKNLAAALANGRLEDEGWRIRKDGSLFWADVIITPVYGGDGRHRGFAKVTRDLTERREAEQNSIRLAHAEEAVRLREEFMSIAAHELRTPLNALHLQITALNLLLERTPSAPPDRADLAARTRRALHVTKRLGALVSRLLDTARISSGRLVLEKKHTDLVRSAYDLLDTLHERIESKHTEVRISAPEEAFGDWDPLRIEQVMYNLVDNAIAYGGSPIDLSIAGDNSAVTIDVRDHGKGISESERSKLFAMPLRGQRSEPGSGLGLGLYISRAIVEEHGGRIQLVESTNDGAHFRITLPRSAEGKTSAAGANDHVT